MKKPSESLDYHLKKVLKGERQFENAFESITRMILKSPDFIQKRALNGNPSHDIKAVEKIIVNGKPISDFKIFRQGAKHMIGMYDELNSLVSFIKDGAQGGSPKEMAFVFVGEPGDGKTFLIEYLSSLYREFLSEEGNRRYTFRFNDVNKMGNYGNIQRIVSQTFEDPMILAMNFFESRGENIRHLSGLGFKDKQIEAFYEKRRPLAPCTEYILNELKELTGGDIKKINEFIDIIPVPLSETTGVITAKYPAGDKITSSAVDIRGDESMQRLLHITDTDNPYLFDLRVGALARVAGGGIYFIDEIYKIKRDLLKIFLGVIQDRNIELRGYKWPIDSFLIATSNSAEFDNLAGEEEESPLVNRCKIEYMGHNTNYKLQEELTRYALGSKTKTTFTGEEIHIDPNLIGAASVAVTLTRMIRSKKLTPVEMMQLAAGETAGEKSVKTLAEIIDERSREVKVSKRFGQSGLGHRHLARAIQLQIASSATNEGKCMHAYDIFWAFERVVLDEIRDSKLRSKYLEDLKIGKGEYRKIIKTSMFNAYMDDPKAIESQVRNYVNMIIGIDADNLGPDKIWHYIDPQTEELKPLSIDEKWIESVESRLGHNTNEARKSFRATIGKIYGQKIGVDPSYNFMDNQDLVKAITEVRLESDVAGAGSLVGALVNRTNDENKKLYNQMMVTMDGKIEDGKLGYCKTCAQKTIEYFCTKQDEN